MVSAHDVTFRREGDEYVIYVDGDATSYRTDDKSDAWAIVAEVELRLASAAKGAAS